MLKNPRFLLSTLKDFPTLKDPQGNLLPEIALAGKSNVGKSSLINHLCNQKKLAKTSSTPGKTQLINFFSIDDRFLLVDLPGYGFAKAPLDAVAGWSEAIDFYLNHRPTLKRLLLLIDCRRELCAEDLALAAWARDKQIPLLAIMTKTDKLSDSEIKARLERMEKQLQCEVIPYTTTNTFSRTLLTRRIESWD